MKVYALCLLSLFAIGEFTPLDDYVNKPDSTYKYEDLGDPDVEEGYKTYYINLTSQTWLTKNDLDRSVWWHYLVIFVPDKVAVTDTAFIFVTGGSNTNLNRPDKSSTDMVLPATICLTTGSVTAVLFQIPNQPIVFTQDQLKKRRTEDAIIAFTWYYYEIIRDPEWLLRLPMTKAVVRAMDTITDYAPKHNSTLKIDKFVVAGASKRGWTTWTTAAVDKRVIGIVPIVMDLLNMRKNLHHHYRSLGGWTFAFADYLALNITAKLDEPVTQDLADVVDPFSYVNRLTMPKLIVTTSGDEFFLPDDSYYFWNDLKGEKYLRILPNAEHSCTGHAIELMLDARAFYLSLVMNYQRPKISWVMEQSATKGSIILKTDVKPLEVIMYHAITLDDKRRDFRLIVQGPDGKPTAHLVLWAKEKLSPNENGEYVASMDVPEIGWRAFFIEVSFIGPESSVIQYTTQANIIPNTFPFPDCHGIECAGKLV